MENLNSHIENEVLWKLLANPTEVNYSQIFTLQLLVDDFPQSGVLRALRVTKNDEQNVKHAVAYFNPVVLYKLVHTADSLAVVTPDKVAYIDPALTKLNKTAATFTIAEDKNTSIVAPQKVEITSEVEFHQPAPIEEKPATEQDIYRDLPYDDGQSLAPLKIEAVPEIKYYPPEMDDKPLTKTDVHHDLLDEMDFTPFVWGDEPKKEPKVEVEQTVEPVESKHEEPHRANELAEYFTPAETNDTLPVVADEVLVPALPPAKDESLNVADEAHAHVAEEVHQLVLTAVDEGLPMADEPHAPVIEAEQQPVLNVDLSPASPEMLPLVEEVLEQLPDNEQAAVVTNTTQVILPYAPSADIAIGTDESLFVPAQHEAVEALANNEVLEDEEDMQAYSYAGKTAYFQQDIDDEIYDEIVSIEDINLEQLAAFNAEFGNISADNKDIADDNAAVAVKPIIDGDHFVFEGGVAENGVVEDVIAEAPVVIPAAAEDENKFATETIDEGAETINENAEVTNYHDDKLPYTFMWWLDKTRKKYASTYQPYVKNAVQSVARTAKKVRIDELQQQYVESIYSVTVVEGLEKSGYQKPEPAAVRKEDKIIERFIQTEPQIQHSGATKLDNENKAKKSSEDRDELVTETLARIYTEQMLYQKAIAVYKKLMLKIPEKSLYFAGQIEELEKKIF